MERHGGTMPEGVERAVVPAALDAWLTALETYGTMSFADIAAWALRFAHEGFPAHDLMIGTITTHREGYARWPSSAAIFLPGGEVPRPGQLFVQSDLARTLAYLCQEEQAASGSREDGIAAVRRAFYEGDVAAAMTDFVAGQGGFLSRADMAGFRCRVEEPVSVAWRGQCAQCLRVPWCQGSGSRQWPLRQGSRKWVSRATAHNAPRDHPHALRHSRQRLRGIAINQPFARSGLQTKVPLAPIGCRVESMLRARWRRSNQNGACP